MRMFESFFGGKEKITAEQLQARVQEFRGAIREALLELDLSADFPVEIDSGEDHMLAFDVSDIATADRTQLDHIHNVLNGLYGSDFIIGESADTNRTILTIEPLK